MSTVDSTLPEVSQNPTERPLPVPSKPLSRWLFVGLAAGALVLGVVIFWGIHERAHADRILANAPSTRQCPQ